MSNSTKEIDETQKDDDGVENIGLGCALEAFSEIDEVLEMIGNLKEVYNAPLSTVEKAYERFLYILSQYHEQPHLLDSHLDRMLDRLISIIRDTASPTELIHATFKYMYIVIKVRSYKIVVRHLPHEVSDFEPILQCLESQDPNCSETWTTRYVLLLWFSIIVKIPFHISRLDDSENKLRKTVVERVYEICKTYIVVGDKCRDAAAFLASHFLTRIDVSPTYLPEFFKWAQDIVNNKDSSIFAKQGALATIANVLKHGKREDIVRYADDLLQWIINTDYKESASTQVRKLGFKIIQRIGLTYLKPRLAGWRYQRGNRTLTANLMAGDNSEGTTPETTPLRTTDTDVDEDIEIPEGVEDVLDELMQGLRSPHMVVRWCAAKGVGRVTARLPKDLADEVVESVLELFNPREREGAWHGGCLSLAELGRRGLLLPQRLPAVVPVIVKALMYDELHGYASVGAPIRDSACYVCWAFARAYEVDVLRPYVDDIARALLIVAVFDREVNCRRAASAAFQENVGRQGTFPHGIDILTMADFFAVGVRTFTYLSLSVYIAQFEEYKIALIDHLIERKVEHWDSAIRELAAKALHNLTPNAPEYMATSVLDKLLAKTKSIDLNARHGAVLAMAEILHALSILSDERKIIMADLLKEEDVEQLRQLIPSFRQRLFFRGLGGELMKQACSEFIKKCSLAHLPFHNTPVIDDWLGLLNECLSYEVPTVREGAVDALPALLTEYYQTDPHKQETIVDNYIAQLKEHNKVARMGYVLALGSLPAFALRSRLSDIIDAIIPATEITESTLKWAESRRDALKALTQICVTVCEDKEISLDMKIVKQVYDCFLSGLLEYTQDNRGDIGAWVREAAMHGIQTLTTLLAKQNPEFLDMELMRKLVAGLIQQAVEKIDRTRAIAGRIFSNIIHNDPTVPNIPFHDELRKVFPAADSELVNWNSEAVTFPKFVQLLPLTDYTYNLLLGLIVSIGGLSETLTKTSSASFFSCLNTLKEEKGIEEIARLCNVILDIFTKYKKVDRVTVPMFRFIEKLMSSGCIQGILDDPESQFAAHILRLIKMEITSCRDIYKLIDGIGVICQFIQVPGEVSSSAIVQLSILLCHTHTYVRKSTSTRFYEALLVYGECSVIPADKLDEVMSIVSDTNWEESADTLRPIRNSLCELMGVRVPVMKTKK